MQLNHVFIILSGDEFTQRMGCTPIIPGEDIPGTNAQDGPGFIAVLMLEVSLGSYLVMFNVNMSLVCSTRTLKSNFLLADIVYVLELAFPSQSAFINSVEQSPLETASCLDGKILCCLKSQFVLHNCSSLGSVVSQKNSVHFINFCLLDIDFNIVFHMYLALSGVLFTKRF